VKQNEKAHQSFIMLCCQLALSSEYKVSNCIKQGQTQRFKHKTKAHSKARSMFQVKTMSTSKLTPWLEKALANLSIMLLAQLADIQHHLRSWPVSPPLSSPIYQGK